MARHLQVIGVSLSRIFSNYNDIRVEVRERTDGFLLVGRHSFFSKYTFDIGPQGPAVRNWVTENADRLQAAQVRGVGVGSTETTDSVYYELPASKKR
jgi:hypothetical protein